MITPTKQPTPIRMARVVLSDNITIRGARRALTRHKSSFALTLRNGQLYTYRKSPAVQPNSAAQLKARSLLKQANVLAREDLLRPGRRQYWERRAHSTGYKTAIGCARAYFVARLRAQSTAVSVSSPIRPVQHASARCCAPHPSRRLSSPPAVIQFRRLRSRISFSSVPAT